MGIGIINKLENAGNKKEKTQKNINIISTNISSPITKMIIDKSETFIICSNKIGVIFIFMINKMNKSDWILKKEIYDNQAEITSIDLNENLNIFATCDKNGYNNLYTFPNCKLFNSFRINENIFSNSKIKHNSSDFINDSNSIIDSSHSYLFVGHVIISNSPLPSLIYYIKSRKSLLVFSINFHFIKEIKLGYEIVPNGIQKYSDSKDYLFIYNTIDNVIEVYDLVDYNSIIRSAKINYDFIDFHFTRDKDYAWVLVKINDEKTEENIKDKNEQKTHKILFPVSKITVNFVFGIPIYISP